MYPKVQSKHLQLEILESSALGDLKSISTAIKTCIDTLGLNIALDDFGAGYSSLTHLRNLAAKTIKIDQTFVRDILDDPDDPDDPDDYAIIDGVIGLAKSFNREVIVEGVETSEHGLILLIMGCYEAQGYGIARPMPADQVPGWLNSYTPNEAWLACSNKERSLKESKIKLLRLTTEQWYKKFESKILETEKDDINWPISCHTKCHLGNWLQRAKQEQLFDEIWVKKLDEEHVLMHNMAEDIFHIYQEGRVDEAKHKLKEMQINFEKITNVLGEWE